MSPNSYLTTSTVLINQQTCSPIPTIQNTHARGISLTASSPSCSDNSSNNSGSTLMKQSKPKREKLSGGVEKKKRKKAKNRIEIPVHDLIRVMNLPQTEAATKLHVSLSTLKRRFYELGMGRWPANLLTHSGNNNNSHSSSPIIHEPCTDKRSLNFLLNEKEEDSNYIDVVSLMILNLSFKQHITQEKI
ncbi:hypothetical protein ABK040_004850 [Willaertia magna]